MPIHVSGFQQFIEQARWWTDAAVDLLFPPRCAGCGRVGAHLCPRCRESFVPLVDNGADGLQAVSGCDQIACAYVYEGALRLAIHALKYKHVRQLAEPLAQALADRIRLNVDAGSLLCPVPMHEIRRRERGYNHAELLATSLSRIWDNPLVQSGVLRRSRVTSTQVGLDYASRYENVSGAFEAQSGYFQGKSVIVVDDVITTGATMQACAKALKAAGAARITGIALARTVLMQPNGCLQ
nr:ComF family protein [Anaerolineae bacterium]